MSSNAPAWLNKELVSKGEQLVKRGEVDTMIGELAVNVAREEAKYDAGFEAGVLASEAGLGRYVDEYRLSPYPF